MTDTSAVNGSEAAAGPGGCEEYLARHGRIGRHSVARPDLAPADRVRGAQALADAQARDSAVAVHRRSRGSSTLSDTRAGGAHASGSATVADARAHGELLRRMGPTPMDAAIRLEADRVTGDLARDKDSWRKGFTRRRVLAGAGAVGAASLGTQLVTTRYSFADPATTTRTLVTIFLRGGMDGLSVIQPANDAYLSRCAPPSPSTPRRCCRPTPGSGSTQRWPRCCHSGRPAPWPPSTPSPRLTPAAATSRPRTATNAGRPPHPPTPAGSTGRSPRSDPEPTFRAIAEGDTTPRSMVGIEPKLVLDGIQNFALSGRDGMRDRTIAALQALYTGLDHPAASFALDDGQGARPGPSDRAVRLRHQDATTPAAASPTSSATWPG